MECRDLCFMFKYLNRGFDVDLQDFMKITVGRTRKITGTLKLHPVHRDQTSIFIDSYFNRIVIIWNDLLFQIR